MSAIDVSAIVTAHGEGAIAGLSLRSMADAAAAARDAGVSVELLAIMDRPTPATERLFAETSLPIERLSCDFGDQGAARNLAAGHARGRFLAFLDADDLWSENWLADGVAAALRCPVPAIFHPEVNWFFGERNSLFFKIGDDDPAFDPAFLRYGNYWDAMMIVPRDVMLAHPFPGRDLQAGFAYEDWSFAARSHAAGISHRIVPGTIHFKRRREGSQHSRSVASDSLPSFAPLFDYGWPAP